MTANGYTGSGGGGGGGSVAWVDITGKPSTFATTSTLIGDATTTGKAVIVAASQAAARTALGLGSAAVLAVGTSSGTVAAGDDSRFTNARTPTTHASTHADGGSDEVSLDASQITTGSLLVARIPTGTSSSTVAIGNDSRLSDSRTPTAHASTHASAGSDALTLAESQITNLVSDLAAKAPLASPTFTGTPAAPTAAAATNTTQVATTAFATGGVSDHVAAANPHTQYKRTYVESGGTYAVSTTARDFVGTDDPAGKGFTLVAGDKWYAI